MNFALYGFMGVGKTVVGKALAEMTGMAFVDLDEEIVKRAGRTIPEIFDEEGEEAFREIERAITQEIAARDGQVIACGGGTILDANNLSSLKRNSILVHLTAKPEIILKRIEAEGDVRPLLNGEDKLQRIRSLLEARNSAYTQAAELILDTSGMTPEQVAEKILESIREDAG
ncbi:shikimate kinase [Candidatus Bathyarchaeota archaeon]|nr:shikimate kinase [Candidatus Bathyarchaeota archaeon]